MSAVWVPPGQQTFWGPDGKALSLGSVSHFIPNTLTPKLTWADEAQAVANPDVISLDGAGMCSIWGTGLYRQIAKDQFGVQIWDKITGFVSSGGSAGNVNGPDSSIAGHIAVWSDSTGRQLSDGGPFTRPGPQNLAPNSQWEIWSGMTYGNRATVAGATLMPAMTVTANTTGSNTCVLSVTSTHADLKINDLVVAIGAGLDANLKICPMRVISFVPNTSVTVTLPVGLKPAATGTGTLQPINIGMSASITTGDAADGWKKTTALTVWREDNAANIPVGAIYSMGIAKDVTAEEYVFAEMTPNVRWLSGQNVTFGILSWQKLKQGSGTWRPFIQSNGTGGQITYGPAVSGIGFQWQEVSYTVPSDATYLYAGIALNGNAGDIYYISNPVFSIGTSIGLNNYVKPLEILRPVVHISPFSWVNGAMTFPAAPDSIGLYSIVFDAYAETGGAIAQTVTHMTGSLEGINSNALVVGAGGSRVIAWRDNAVDPVRFGPIMAQYGVNVKSFAPAVIPLDGTGRARYWSGVASDSWSNVSMDLDLFYLR